MTRSLLFVVAFVSHLFASIPPYTYDAVGNITRIETPTQTITKTYDALTVTAPQGHFLAGSQHTQGTVTYSYDALGRQTQVAFANGVTTSYGYDVRNRITKIEHKNSADVILQSFTYTLDAVGNRTQIVENSGRTVDYSYNTVNQLTSETISNDTSGRNTVTTFTYDNVGNLLTKQIDGIETTYSYNSNDQLITQNAITLTYDANGNLVSDGNNTYTYDDKNRLTTVTTPTQTVEYSYDANDNRVAKTTSNGTTTYLIDENTPYAQVITENKVDGTTVEYTYGNDLLTQTIDAQSLFYLADALGSVKALANESESITDHYTYSPYGRLIEHVGTSENAFLFTGEQFDSEIESYYLRARYYSPNSTRFLSRDTYDGRDHEPATLNHYGYVHGNPVNYVDPSGYVSMMELSNTISIRGTLQTYKSRTWSVFKEGGSVVETLVGNGGKKSMVTDLVINEVINILVGEKFEGKATTRGSKAHKFLETRIVKFRPLGQFVKLEAEVFLDDKGKKGARNGSGLIGIDILVKMRTGKRTYKPMVLIDLKTGTRKNPNSRNGFSLSRAKEHGRRHGNIPVIEVYIPFI